MDHMPNVGMTCSLSRVYGWFNHVGCRRLGTVFTGPDGCHNLGFNAFSYCQSKIPLSLGSRSTDKVTAYNYRLFLDVYSKGPM